MQTQLSPAEAERLARRIAEARERHGWSLSDVAERTGLSKAYIHRLEKGEAKRPGVGTLRSLEDAIGPLGIDDEPSPKDVPLGLAELAAEKQLSSSQVRLLASLKVRGKQPQSTERWRYIYNALVTSETLDADEETT